jgi:tetratricopeptide (TPR) repeat protein
MKKDLFAVIAILGLVLMICASPLLSQVWARVDGTVKTEKGKAIAGAQVILIFAKDKAKVEFTTDEKGRWKTANLRPGAWTIGFLADGFQPENINVNLSAVKKNPAINIRLKPIPKSPLHKGDQLYQQKKYKEALDEYQRVLKSNKEALLVHEKIGLCHYRLGNLDPAIVSFKRMLELEPKAEGVLTNLSAIYFSKGNLEEGMKYFKQLDETKITDHTIFYNIGIISFNNNKMEIAIDFFKKCLEREPEYVKAHNQLALAYLNQGDMDKAKAHFKEVIRLAPDSKEAAQAKDMLSAL